jgi:GT2 family glycosyltransferase
MSSATSPAPVPVASRSPRIETRQARPSVRGKFLFCGEEKIYVRGVTYGPFHPDAQGCLYHDPETVDRDFREMAAAGINALRVYTVPPVWLLDAAERHGLWVMVGIPWEQHITFLDRRSTAGDIERRAREAVRGCGAHPAILCFTIGNEIPSSIVRWHGREKIEAFLKRLYRAVKSEDPSALVTYVNFPPTEYLQLDFLDFVSFNVYLERQERLEAYLARLQNLAGNRPLVMAEVGLDSRRNGLQRQAETLDWQIRTVFTSGCAGVFLFAWTDEWSRGGFEIDDWDFGLTTRNREPKPALAQVRNAFAEAPFFDREDWPFFSVVVCSYNGSRTIRQTLEEVCRLEYPRFEVIVVDDGSTDSTAEIARTFPGVRLISVPNGGLSAARNLGMEAAKGEIVAYIDDDAYPDAHWLHYLAVAFRRSEYVAIGGPNLPPAGDGPIAECVANSPGGPQHVLLTDMTAEHIPGCNFVVRRDALRRIGGFDPRYRVAGDDVDACWRLQETGEVGFAPAALVWHHRRNSVRAYWKQQKGYGRAEALLERKWPLKYNAAGHLAWLGRVYGPGALKQVGGQWRVYQGTWGSALFQSIYEPAPGLLQSYAQMPEWHLLVLCLAAVSALGMLWTPLFGFGVLLAAAVGLPLAQAIAGARRAQFPSRPAGAARLRLLALTTLLFAIQPVARLWGRISFGLTPWRRKRRVAAAPWARTQDLWSEGWQSAESWLGRFESEAARDAFVQRGGDFDRWDLEIRGGLAGSARVSLAIEEHGGGRQLLRWRIRPRVSRIPALLGVGLIQLTAFAVDAAEVVAGGSLGTGALALVVWMYRDAALASGAVTEALRRMEKGL